MKIPIGMVEEFKDKMKGSYPILLRVWTHEGLRAHWTKGKLQTFKEAQFIKFFSNKQSYAAPDIKFSKSDDKNLQKTNIKFETRTADFSAWDCGKVQDDDHGTFYEVYLANDYELYPIDVRGSKTKELFLAWKNATIAYQEKMRLLTPSVSLEGLDELQAANKKAWQEAYAKGIEQEQAESRRVMEESYKTLEAWSLRDTIFFDPQMSASATQTLINGFAAIYEYMRDQLQQNMLLWQGIALVLVALVLLGGGYLYYDNSNKMTEMTLKYGAQIAQALPSYIQECAKAGYVALPKAGV
jgi:hypothetical protein